MEQITHKVILQIVTGGNGLTSFSETIDVPFTPTHIKFSNIYYDAINADATPHVLSSNLITSIDNRVEVVHDGAAPGEPTVFTNSRPVNGTYQFYFDNNGIQAGNFSMRITFMR
jgi:hypothetical protein